MGFTGLGKKLRNKKGGSIFIHRRRDKYYYGVLIC